MANGESPMFCHPELLALWDREMRSLRDHDDKIRGVVRKKTPEEIVELEAAECARLLVIMGRKRSGTRLGYAALSELASA